MKTAYLDIETSYLGKLRFPDLCRDYKNHKITVIGVRIMEDAEDAFVQLVGREATRELLMTVLKGIDRLVTYNGRSIPDTVKRHVGFDFPVIAAQLGVVLDREFPHVDLCPECWKAGLWGGQKAVEQALGLKRSLPGKDGAWADQTWKEYEKTRDKRLLDDLMAYNREDVFMLGAIEEALAQR